MKYLLALMIMLPTFAFAFPAVGDYVKFVAYYEQGQVIEEKWVLAHDEAEDAFEVRNRIMYLGYTIKDETYVLPRSFMYDAVKVAHVLATCEEREGAISLVTVKETQLKVCEFYHEDSQLTYMIGPVPFGQVRYQTYLEGEDFLDFNLVDFHL